jgi:hypothetical protein
MSILDDVGKAIEQGAGIIRGSEHGRAGTEWRKKGPKPKNPSRPKKPKPTTKKVDANKAIADAGFVKKSPSHRTYAKQGPNSYRHVGKPGSKERATYDNAKKASANAAKAGPDTMRESRTYSPSVKVRTLKPKPPKGKKPAKNKRAAKRRVKSTGRGNN